MIIAATNNKDLLEKTFESRMTYKIKIVLPGMKERITMLKNYLPRFFKSADIEKFFTEKDIEQLANKTEGFTGRTITQMLNAIGIKKILSRAIIDQMVNDFVQQEKADQNKK